MRTCDRCGEALHDRTAVKGPYQYKLSGLSNVFLIGITVRHCTGCGRESPVIPKLGQLHEVIAKVLLLFPTGSLDPPVVQRGGSNRQPLGNPERRHHLR